MMTVTMFLLVSLSLSTSIVVVNAEEQKEELVSEKECCCVHYCVQCIRELGEINTRTDRGVLSEEEHILCQERKSFLQEMVMLGIRLISGESLRTVHAGNPYFHIPLCCAPSTPVFDELIVTGSSTFNDVLVNGDLAISGSLILTFPIDFGDACITSSFCVDGPVTFNNTLTVVAATELDSLLVTNSATIDGDLEVTGTIIVGADIAIGGALGATGITTLGVVNATTATIGNLTVTTSLGGLLSDKRLKQNIQNLSPADSLKALLKVHPVSYEWVNPDLHGGACCSSVGFIAQDLKKLIPEVVVECPVHEQERHLVDGESTALGIRLSHELSAYIVASIHALSNQIKKLQKEVNALTTQ